MVYGVVITCRFSVVGYAWFCSIIMPLLYTLLIIISHHGIFSTQSFPPFSTFSFQSLAFSLWPFLSLTLLFPSIPLFLFFFFSFLILHPLRLSSPFSLHPSCLSILSVPLLFPSPLSLPFFLFVPPSLLTIILSLFLWNVRVKLNHCVCVCVC